MKISKFGIGWYERDDYPRIREVMTDADKLPLTYDEWLQGVESGERNLKMQGRIVIRVLIKSEAFVDWCKSRGLEANSHARNLFGNEAVLAVANER